MRRDDVSAMAAAGALAAGLGMALLLAPAPALTPARQRTDPSILSRLGSRLTVIPEPDRGYLRILPLGLHLPELRGLRLTARRAGSPAALRLPAAEGEAPSVRQRVTPTSVTLAAPLPQAAAEVTWRIASPFCPGLPAWRDAPLMILTAGVRNRTAEPMAVSLDVDLLDGGGAADASDHEVAALAARVPFHLLQTKPSTDLLRRGIARHLQAMPVEASVDLPPGAGSLALAGSTREGWRVRGGRLRATLVVPPHDSALRELVLAFHTSSPVHMVDGTPRRFAYTKRFASADDVVRRALPERARLQLEDRRAVDMMLLRSEPAALQRLAALALQTFLANTWLLEGREAPFRYSEWEGYPRFHATLDVTFNNTPFYTLFAPDLLADLLRHWPDYGDAGGMPHDIGQGLVIDRTVYPSRMPVEEDANFLLLHHAYARATGDVDLATTQRPLLHAIALRLMESDRDGDGLPDHGVVNTFDDAPYMLNAAPNQLYLGIKAAAALHAYVALAPHTDLPDHLERRISAHLDRATATVQGSWRADHYPIVKSGTEILPAKRRRLVVPRGHGSTEPPAAGRPDGYANYHAHGLVPLLMTGDRTLARAMPQMAAHLEAAHARTATPYGDAHTDETTNVWVSQNLWRDAAALYLGARLDIGLQAERYWAVQTLAAERKQTAPWWEAFCDSPENEILTAYARGAGILLIPWARRGITFDRLEGTLHVPPRWRRGRLDVPQAADWGSGRVPALIWEGTSAREPRRAHADLLAGVEIQ